MRADHHIHAALPEPAQDFCLFLRRAEARNHIHFHRESLKALEDRLIVLKGKDRRWHEHGALLALRNALKGGAQGNLCFAKAYVAAKQAVHRIIFLHIAFDFVNATQLIVCFLKFKAPFKIVLHVRIWRECIAWRLHALRIELGKLLCHIFDSGAHARAGFLPLLAAEAVDFQALAILMRADVFGNEIKLRDGDV